MKGGFDMANTPPQPQLSYSQTRLSQACQWNAIWAAFSFSQPSGRSLRHWELPSLPAPPTRPATSMPVWRGLDHHTDDHCHVRRRAPNQQDGGTTRNDGLIHGMMMFGLSVVGVLVPSAIGSAATATNVHPLFSLRFVMGRGWASFIALLLGWLAATGGASTLDRATITAAKQPVPMRPAA